MAASCWDSGTRRVLPTRAEDLLGVGEVLGGGVAAGGDDGHGLVDEGGGVRHDADDGGALGEAFLEEGGGDARGAADDQAVGGDVRGEFVEERAHVLGLDGEDEGVGALGGLGVGDGLDAVAGAELLGAFGAAGRDQEVGGGPAGADHSAEQGLADLAGAEDCDCLGHARFASPGVRCVRRPILAPGAGGGRVVRWAVRGWPGSGGGARVTRCGGGGWPRRGPGRAGRRPATISGVADEVGGDVGVA